MSLRWYLCPYDKRQVGRRLVRTCAMNRYTPEIERAEGRWSEIECLSSGEGHALVLVDAPDATQVVLAQESDFLAFPDLSLVDPLGNLTGGERNALVQVARDLGYTQADVDAQLPLGIPNSRFNQLLRLFAAKRRRVRRDENGDFHLDGPLQWVKPLASLLDWYNAFPTTSVIETFTGANGTSPPNSNWSGPIWMGDEVIEIQSNQGACGTADSYGAGYWNVETFSNDVEIYFTIGTKPGAGYDLTAYAMVVNPNDTFSGYALTLADESGTDTWDIVRVDDEESTVLGATISQEYSAGNKAGLEIQTPALQAYRFSSGSWATLSTARTDGTYTSGYIGCEVNHTTGRIDDLGGGTIVVGPVPIDVTDAGSGADTPTIQATVATIESGSGAESPALAALLALTEAGAGLDTALAAILAALLEAASGTDAPVITVAFTTAESGSGTVSPAADVVLSLTDTGAGTDTITRSVIVALVEAASGLDSPNISVSAPISDTGTGTDTPSETVALTVSDSSTGTETPLITVLLSLADTGTGLDAVIVQLIKAVLDSATGTDTPTITVHAPLTDTLSGLIGPTIAAQFTLTDSGTGTDTPTVFAGAMRLVLDAGSGSDTLSIAATLSTDETSAGSDALALSVVFTMAESGTGADIEAVAQLLSIIEAAQGSDSPLVNAVVGMDESGSGTPVVSLGASIPVSEAGAGVDVLAVVLLKALADTAFGTDVVSLSATIPIPDTAQGLDSLGQILAQLAITDAATGTETVTRTFGGIIVDMSFSLAQRTATITLTKRSQTQSIATRSATETIQGGGNP